MPLLETRQRFLARPFNSARVQYRWNCTSKYFSSNNEIARLPKTGIASRCKYDTLIPLRPVFGSKSLAFLEYLYTLRRTYILTSHTKYAILFSYHKWLLVGCWMSRCF